MNEKTIEVHCERCGGKWMSPVGLPATLTDEVAAMLQRDEMIPAIARLRECTGMGLRDAKAICMHVAEAENKCHRCGTSLLGEGTTTCENCGSLNYFW